MRVMAIQKSDGAFCPRFHTAVELVGRRWTGAILRAMRSGECRFSDIASVIPGLHDRLLADRLRELEAAGVIRRAVSPSAAGRAEYHLTEMGRDLDHVMDAIAVWAERWVPGPPCAGAGEIATVSEACAAVIEVACARVEEAVGVGSAEPAREQ